MPPIDEQRISRIEQLLEDSLELSEENNKLLRNLRRTQRWSFLGKLILWVLLLGLPLLFFKPLISSLTSVPGSQGGSGSFLSVPNTAEVQQLIETYKASRQGSSTPQ